MFTVMLISLFCIKKMVKPSTTADPQQPDAVYRNLAVALTSEDITEDEKLTNCRLMRTFYANVVVFVVFYGPLVLSGFYSLTFKHGLLVFVIFKVLVNPIVSFSVNPEFRVLFTKMKLCQ